MKKLIVYYGDAPECVEGFPKDCKRSCKGALHIHRGKSKTITDGEYEYIKSSKRYKHLLNKIRVVSEIKAEVAKPKKKVEAPKVEEKAASSNEKKEIHSGKKKHNKKR